MTIEYKDSKRITGLSTDVILPTPETISGFTISGTSGKVSESSGTLSFTINSSGQSTLAVKALSANANSSYTLRYKLTITTDDISFSQAGNITSGTTSVTSGIGEDPPNSSYSIYLKHALHADVSANYSANGSSKDNDWGNGISNGSGARTKYVEIINNASSITTRYTDSSDYTGGLVTPAWSAQSGAQSGAKGNIFFNFFSQNVSSGSIVGTISEIKLYNDASSSKPTDVQDNSLLVEKDTANRYWFNAESSNTVTFQSDLSSSTGWTTTGSKVSIDTTNEEIDFSFNTDNGDLSHTYYDLTSVSDTKWVLRSQIDIDTVTQGSDVGDVFIFYGIGSTNQNGNESQDFLGLMFRVDNTKTDIFVIETDGTDPNNETTTLFTRQLQAETLYVEMIRESATSFTINLYSDSGYSTLLESKTITVPSSVQTLRYLKVAGIQGYSDSQVVGSVPNITLYNDVTSATIPATWTMQPTFRDDFSTDRWVDMDSSKIGVNTTLERLDFDIKRDGSNDGSALDLGRTLSDTKWRVDYDLSLTTLTESGNSVILHVGLSDEDQTSDSANSQDAYTLRIDVWSAGQVTKLTDSEAQTLEGTALHTFTDLTTTDYYISMIRNSATQCQLIIYSDSARTTVVEDSGIKTTTSGINGLRYFKVTNGGGSSGTGAIIGNIKNLKIYNGVTSIN